MPEPRLSYLVSGHEYQQVMIKHDSVYVRQRGRKIRRMKFRRRKFRRRIFRRKEISP